MRRSDIAKFKKLRAVVLLPKVTEAIAKRLAGWSKGWLSQAIVKGISLRDRSKIRNQHYKYGSAVLKKFWIIDKKLKYLLVLNHALKYNPRFS